MNPYFIFDFFTIPFVHIKQNIELGIYAYMYIYINIHHSSICDTKDGSRSNVLQ